MSTDFSRTYMPPGVYIEEDESVVVTTTGVPPTLVALVGQARGFQVNVEQVPFGSGPVVLSKQGIDTDTVEIVVASTREAIEATDYTLTPTTPGADPQDYYVELVATSNNTLDEGTAVFVTYNYTPVDYYSPKRMLSYEDVTDIYGEPLNLTPGAISDPTYQHVLSPLSLASKVAFENGATELLLCAATPPPSSATTDSAQSAARRTALADAYAKTASLPSVNLIVGVATGIATADASGALTDLANHVDTAGDDGFLRFGVIGFDTTVTTAPDTLIATSGAKNRRTMLAYTGPGGLLMYSGGVNATFSASHGYLAAAYAGRMASLPVQRSLTKQPISSFSGLGGTPLSNALKSQYAQAGVAVAEVDRLGRLVVRHGVTTDNTNINTREAAVVRARDALVTMVSNGFAESDLIGQPVDDEVVYTIKSAMQGFLETAVGTETIVSYSGLAVRQRVGDPSTVEVKFAYKPAYPLNYIAVSFSIDMTTGATDDLADAA